MTKQQLIDMSKAVATQMDDIQLAKLVPMKSSQAVYEEVETTLRLFMPDFNFTELAGIFKTVKDLYNGGFPGYQACNTYYHDFRHITDTFIAMARLIHGAHLEGHQMSPRQVYLGLASALLHDTGYIQDIDDNEGTGAKYTADHVRRSNVFLERHREQWGFSQDEAQLMQAMILVTDLSLSVRSIDFPDPTIELLGKMLGTADLLAQMADRVYLEKLLYLYHEFRESQVGGYKGEIDLLRKSIKFMVYVRQRFRDSLGGVDHFMVTHFKARWNVEKNLYLEAIDRQNAYLHEVLSVIDADPRDLLKRDDIVTKVRDIFHDCG